MTAPRDGGPAFPVLESLDEDMRGNFTAQTVGGMSLRAYLAGQALAGVAANPASGCNSPRDLGHWAVACADAVIRELAK